MRQHIEPRDEPTTRMPTRRAALAGTGVILLGALAGCSGESEPSGEETAAGTDPGAAAPTSTPTPEVTPEATEAIATASAATESDAAVLTEAPEEPPEDASVPDNAEDDMSGTLGPAEFESVLRQNFDGEVHSYTESDGEGLLRVYTLSNGDADKLATEIAQVAGVYAAYLDYAKNRPSRLVVGIYVPSGELAGVYQIDSAWADAYREGNISGEEYLTRIFNTIETE